MEFHKPQQQQQVKTEPRRETAATSQPSSKPNFINCIADTTQSTNRIQYHHLLSTPILPVRSITELQQLPIPVSIPILSSSSTLIETPMKQNEEDMLTAKQMHTIATPRSSAATLVQRKRHRSPGGVNANGANSKTEAFPTDVHELVAPKLLPPIGSGNGSSLGTDSFHRLTSRRSFSDKSQGQGHIILPSPQQVGVFGVDAHKRINLWNDFAASVTGAGLDSVSDLDLNENEDEDDLDPCEESNMATTSNGIGNGNGNCANQEFGMLFHDLFPPSQFEVSNPAASKCPEQDQLTASFGDVLDQVFLTGLPSVGVPVTTKAGRKRGRGEMAFAFAFSVDLLPQFDSSSVPPSISGVVLVCKSDTRILHHKFLDNSNSNSNSSSVEKKQSRLIDMARHHITMPPCSIDKPRSLSAGSSGTCPTETNTEGTAGSDLNYSHELDTELGTKDDSERTECDVDDSFHTCVIDGSFRTGYNNAHAKNINKNKRLEALEAFESSAFFENSDSYGSDEDNDLDDRFANRLPLPPLYTINSPRGITRKGIATNTSSNAVNAAAADSADNEDYHTLFETIDSIVIGVDRSGLINVWNHKIEELTGISSKDAIGRSMVGDTTLPFVPFLPHGKTLPPGVPLTLRGELEPLLSDAYNGVSTKEFNVQVQLPDTATATATATAVDTNSEGATTATTISAFEDKLRHLVGGVSSRYNKQKQIVGALFLGSDVTDGFTRFRRVVTDAHELRKLIDTANAPIFGIDAKGYVKEWNNKTAEITGYGKDEAMNCPLVKTFIFPDIQESVQAVLQNALQNGKGTSNYELEFKTKSDEIRHLLVNITPQYDMNNNVVGVVLIAQDVTEAVERDRAVASMALELRQLIDTANAPIFGIDVHGKVNEWNTRMSTITGYSKEEAFQNPLVENFIAPSMKEKVGEILEAALNGNETSNYEVEVTSKSGEPICLLVNATTRRDPDSDIVGVVGVAQDVTEDRKHSKALREMETLQASQEAKVETERNMTAYFAHELRNPLGAIDSALAAMPDKLPENAHSLVSGMQLCTKFMSSIMNNLLDVRKMEEGRMRLRNAPVSIHNMFQSVHKMILPSVRPGVEFRKLINVKGNHWVLGDAHRIEQVLTNVISNAIKYTTSGHIQISIEWENNKLKFVCEDTGPGIPKSEQPKLYQRFARGGAPGSGLGLAIAKHVVDLTGGSIRFESDPTIKSGTTCIVLLPLPLCNAPESSVKEKAPFITEELSVLIIDDIKMNRTMVKRRMLKGVAPNAKIQEAATGEEALVICGKNKFDVMIVDQFMEGAGGVMVGTDVVFAMRRMRIDSVLIGCSGNDIGTQFFDAGADMVWQKPMPTNDQIIRDLRSSLDKRGIILSSRT